MREQLLGYVLGALEPNENQQVEARLQRDPELRRELELIQRSLEPLNYDSGHTPPPPGLARRTCRYVAMRSSLSRQTVSGDGWRLQDLLVAAGIVIAASMLVFPAIANSRYNARLTACQNNLRSLGKALLQYSQIQNDMFPVVPVEGNRAAAGVYAPQLLAKGLLENPHAMICPASQLAEDGPIAIPTLDELDAATPDELPRLQRRMGGSYGYSFGYVQDGQYQPLRNRARPHFALMADAPTECTSGSSNHGTCGQNVLFEDGRVAFLKRCRLDDSGDHIFQNQHGYVGAGIGPNDSVIGASDAAPVILPVVNK